MIELTALVRMLQKMRVDLSDEKRAQTDIATAFSAAEVPFERERRLGPKDVPDFFVPDGVVVEVKLSRNRKIAIYKQLERYAVHDDVKAIILASNFAMTLPAMIEGKPAFLASLGRGWL